VAIAQPAALGDVVACLPMAHAIKALDPQPKVIFIGRPYSRSLIEASTLIDHFIDAADVVARPEILIEHDVRVFLNPYLPFQLGMAARRANVSLRVGNLRRPSTLFWANRFIAQGALKVQRHRALLNLAYLRPLGLRTNYSLDDLSGMLGLDRHFPLADWLSELLDPRCFNLVLHPGSNGNAREWPAPYFDRLVDLLPSGKVKVFVTGMARERDQLYAERVLLGRRDVVDLTGRLDLAQLIAFLKAANGFVGGSTGPLHIAAGLGIHALGLFPGRDRATAARWRPLGKRAEALSFRDTCTPGPGRCPKIYDGGFCSCMSSIHPETVAKRILSWMG
jgi:heptosyltransferase-3